MPKIDGRLCIGCGACEYICPADVIRTKRKKAYVAYPEDCLSVLNCWLCVHRCPVRAISWADHRDKVKKEFTPGFAWNERKRAWGIDCEEPKNPSRPEEV